MGDMLAGRVAVVTGAGRGIGRGVALALAQAGAKVVVNDYGVSVDGSAPSSGPAFDVVREIEAAGGEAVASPESVAEWDGGGTDHRDGGRAFRSDRHPGHVRRHPARPHDLQHERGGVGRRPGGAPEGHVQLRAARVHAHARAALRAHHHLQLGLRALRQSRPGELRRRQGGNQRAHEGGGARPRPLRHHRERDLPGRRDAHDRHRRLPEGARAAGEAGHPARGPRHRRDRAARPGRRRADGRLPGERSGGERQRTVLPLLRRCHRAGLAAAAGPDALQERASGRSTSSIGSRRRPCWPA